VAAMSSERLGRFARQARDLAYRRYSRRAARQRWQPLSRFMWYSIPAGLAVFTAGNISQIVQSWHDYKHGWVVPVLLAAIAGVFALVWARSWHGVGPAVSAIALVTGPAACLIIARQLSEGLLTSPANWVSGFCVVPIILLPFSRPLEEMVLGIVALIAVQGAVMANVGDTPRDLHSIVMSGGAGPAIGIGIIFLVAVIRQMDTLRREQVQRALIAIEMRSDQQETVSLRHRAFAAANAAADMLGALAAGTASIAEPEVRRECGRLNGAVRRELAGLGQPPLLRSELMAKGGELNWEIDDLWNVSQHFRVEDQIAIIDALSEIRKLRPDGITIQLLPLPVHHRARIVIISGTLALPETPGWRALLDRFGVDRPPDGAPGDRQIYWWDIPVRHFFGRSDDQDSDH